jgi:2-polyprenyl-3-methyl-5-hydroxy-6-metoxy-1,4-benzoquinol methylase
VDLHVRDVRLSGHVVETPEQDIYRLYACPICGEEDSLQLVAAVEANGKTSLESALCMNCEHRYHRKFPTAQWLQQYYAGKYESNRGKTADVSKVPVVRRGVYRRVRSAVGSWIRYGLSQNKPNRIHEFCAGLTKRDGSYYRTDERLKKILEIGCGYGSNLKFFADLGYETWGTESSPARVAACRQLGLRVVPSAVDGFGGLEREGPFDFIYSSHVLEHVIGVDEHIRQVSAMVRAGGFVYVETPDLSGESLVYQTHTIFHVHTFSASSMLRLLAKHGLQATRVLVDGNIQVLAQKLPDGVPGYIGLSGTIYGNSSVPYLACIARHAPGDFRIRWDHYRIKVERVSDSTVLYDAGLRPLAVAPGPNQHELLCHAPDRVGHQMFPVLFHYDLEDPPIWYKN